MASTNHTHQESASKLNAWFQSYAQNIDALSQASRMTADVFQGISKLQSEHIANMMQDLSQLTQSLAKKENPSDIFKSCAQGMKDCSEKNTENAKKISAFIKKNTADISYILKDRMNQNVKEGRSLYKNLHAQSQEPFKAWTEWLQTSTTTKN